jgi:uncharacterized protein YcnI
MEAALYRRQWQRYKKAYEQEKAKIEAAKKIMQEWFDSENLDESYDHEILCRLDIVLNERKTSDASELQIPRKEEGKL